MNKHNNTSDFVSRPQLKPVPAAQTPQHYLTLQFLQWVSEGQRNYGDAMDAWRTSCPRLSIWEDALRDGLIRVDEKCGAMRHRPVKLTARGKAVLAAESAR